MGPTERQRHCNVNNDEHGLSRIQCHGVHTLAASELQMIAFNVCTHMKMMTNNCSFLEIKLSISEN